MGTVISARFEKVFILNTVISANFEKVCILETVISANFEVVGTGWTQSLVQSLVACLNPLSVSGRMKLA